MLEHRDMPHACDLPETGSKLASLVFLDAMYRDYRCLDLLVATLPRYACHASGKAGVQSALG